MSLINFLLDTPIRLMRRELAGWLKTRFIEIRNGGNLVNRIGTPEMCNRVAIFNRLFEMLKSMKAEGPYTIVEIGCFRGSFLGGEGSTYFFAKWLSENGGGKLHTVDINKKIMEKARAVCSDYDKYIEWHNMRSEDFLRSFSDRVHIVYLDSVGWNKGTDQFSAQYQHWKDWVIIKDKLHGTVGIDDTDGFRFGKGALVVAYLEGKGVPWETIYCVKPDKWPCGVVAKWPSSTT